MHSPRQETPIRTPLNAVASRRASDEVSSKPLPHGRDEQGAVLILALLFVVIVGATVIALLSLGGNGLLDTVKLQQLRSTEYAADDATTAAVQTVRYSDNAYTAPGSCLPVGVTSMDISGVTMFVDCAGAPPALSAQTRVVNFYACEQASCSPSNFMLQAEVTFDDYSATSSYACSAVSTTTCGTGMTIDKWTVVNATS
jgi:hypothetical protein